MRRARSDDGGRSGAAAQRSRHDEARLDVQVRERGAEAQRLQRHAQVVQDVQGLAQTWAIFSICGRTSSANEASVFLSAFLAEIASICGLSS